MHRRPRTFSRRLARGLVGAATVVVAALAVILFGGWWVLKPVRMHAMVAAFMARLAAPAGKL